MSTIPKRLYLLLLLLSFFYCSPPTQARARIYGFCQQGNQTILVLGYRSSTTTPVQGSCPAATVTIFITGTTTPATIFSDNMGTSLSNPFTIGVSPETSSIGYWFFYADNGNYDVQFSGTGVATPFKLTAIPAVDPGTSGGGSVSSVGLALPSSVFTVSGSPVTTSGTLTGAFASQAQNLFLASPNGSSGVPSMRAIVGSDLPFPGATSLGGVQSKDCSSGSQVVQKINTDGTITCITPTGSVTSITATAPIVVSPSPIVSTGVASCPTCTTNAAALTSTALMTGGGGQASQTPAPTATMDGSGNISTPGSITTNIGSSNAGAIALPQGAATAAPTNTVGFQAPTSIATGFRITLWNAPTAGIVRSNAATPSVLLPSELSGDCTTSGSNVTTCNPASSVSAASAAGAAKLICVSSGASKTCTYIDFPEVQVLPSANCDNAVPAALWSIGASGVVGCRAGTNNTGAFITITDTAATFAQFNTAIPLDWDTGTNPYIRFKIASTDNTAGHTIIPAIKISCAKGDGTTTDDVTFNASHSLSTITLNATANQFWGTTNAQMNSTDVTGCIPGGMMIVQVGRATDTATNANFYTSTITFPRALTVQAN
jgi:hypothetical protein